jgi:CHAT domain-containing protein/tetratricopeptide (TPR) repeat protein
VGGFRRARLAAVAAFSAAMVACASQGPTPDALLQAGDYERAEATAAQQLTRLNAATAPASASPVDVLVRARIANGKAARADTIDLAERAVRVTGSNQAPALLNLGQVLVGTAEFERAIEVTRRAVSLLERTASDSLAAAEGSDRLGEALSAAGRYGEALTVLERGLRLKEAALPASAVPLARTLEAIALARQRQGAYEESGQAIRRAVAIQEAANPRHPAFAGTLNLLAQQLWFEGRLLESRAASERAVAIATQALRADHPTIALSLRYLAATATDLGDTRTSLALKRRALTIAEREFGPEHHLTAPYLQTVAVAEMREGDFVSARARFRRALDIVERKYTAWHEYVATTLATLARTDASLGDYASAQQELDRAVEIQTRIGGPDHPYVAGFLTELASVYRDRGLPERALPLLERALAFRERRLGPGHRDVARTLADTASTLMALGQSARAGALALRAETIWRALDAPDAPDYATVLALLAQIAETLGRHADAKSYFARALAMRAKVYGPSHPLYAATELGMGRVLVSLRDAPGAFAAASSAEATARDHARLMLRSLPERQALLFAGTRAAGLDLVLSLSRTLPDRVESAADVLVRSRALVLEEMAARRDTEHAAANSADPVQVAMQSAQQRLANLITRGPAALTSKQYQAVLDVARQEADAAEAKWAARSATFSAHRARAQMGLADVMAALPPDAALVAYVRYMDGSTRREPSYLAFVLRHQRPPVVIALGSAGKIDALVARWRSAILGEAGTGTARGSAARGTSRVRGDELRRLVWDGVAAHLDGTNRVFVVPDGALNLMPFAALPTGPHSFLVETGPTLHYLAAERDLVSPLARSTNRGLLALGGPSFGDRPGTALSGRAIAPAVFTSGPVRGANGCGTLQSVSFTPLSETSGEVQDLGELWTARSAAGAGAATVLTGLEATETVIKREASRYRVLHIATHGFFLNGQCPEDTPGTRGVGGLVASGEPEIVDSLQLSGLAFAGANLRADAHPDQDDGVLMSEEVAGLDLRGVEWAVLSACETGVGEIKAGEGVFGLRRAFQVAGVKTVIMSLWSVEDASTRQWMHALYEERFQHQRDTATAVRNATLTFLRERRAAGRRVEPFYWAAFVAAGDWR